MENKNSLKLKTILYRVALTVIGALIASISINALYIPNNILSGGITGIAILLNLEFGLNTSLVIFLLNIPIFAIGYRFINREFILFSLLGMSSLSFFIGLTSGIDFASDNLLTTILLGGVINGVGFGLIFRAHSSTGGNDIISKVLNKKYSYSIATFNFIFNILIIGLSISFFDIDIAVQTLTAMYISSLTVKFILEGSNYKRTVFIITKQPKDVAAEINKQLDRGCTIIDGTGSYTGNTRYVLYAVISITQLAKLKMIVRKIDQGALINVMETKVVFGNGFVNINEN